MVNTRKSNWYISSINSNDVSELPDGLFITMFDAKNHVDNGLSSMDIKKEYEYNSKAVGEYILSLSPERLALHETIVAMSVNLKFQSEDAFVETFNKIYNEAVLPQIKVKNGFFAGKNRIMKSKIEKSGHQFFHEKDPANIEYQEDFEKYNDKYTKNLEKYYAELNALLSKTKDERPSRNERQKMSSLRETIGFMEENKERIIIDLVVNSNTLKSNTNIVKNIISGRDGVFDSNYINQFDKLTQYNKNDRKAYLIVGGAASGKGSVTNEAKNSQLA